MATSIPTWLTGPGGGITCTIRGQLVSAAGLITDTIAAALTITTILDSVTVRPRVTTETITPVTSGIDNETPIEIDEEMTLTEILQDGAAAATVPQLATIWYSTEGARLALITYQRGGNTFTMTGRMTAYDETGTRGKCTGRLSVVLVDPIDSATGAPIANATYT